MAEAGARRDERRGRGRVLGHRVAVACGLVAALVGVPFGVSGSGVGAEAAAGRGLAGPAAPAAPAAPTDGGPEDVLPPDGSWQVTLLTGEVVDVRSDGEGRVSAQVTEHDGPYRTLRTEDGSLYVIPRSVTPLLGDVLALELFDVTGLVRQGYDDESRDSIGLIAQREAEADAASTFDASDEQALPSIDAVAVEVPKESADEIGDDISARTAGPGSDLDSFDGFTRVWLDSRYTTSATGAVATPASATAPAQAEPAELDRNLTQIGADVAWDAALTGEGTRVAVLDTGIDHEHPDIAGKVVAEENFTWMEDTVDLNGHGTHVAATAAGSGAGAGGARSGVAPDADLVIGKVLDDLGGGWESDIIAGMEWAAPQADVVNMSLGGPVAGPDDPLALAVEQLTEAHDTLFVVAAGNSGPLSASVDSPGVAEAALTVGAVDGDDGLADFSSRGPTAGTYLLKPEVVAPGVDIVAARASEGWIGDPVDDHYATLSGTSMAAPHVAGAAAVLAQQHPDWTAAQLKSALVGSATPLQGDGFDVGAGRLDIGTGISASLQADRGALSAVLPEPRTEPHQEQVAWTNHGDEPMTVAFAADLADRDGDPVEALTVEPAQLTLAPGETGSVTVQVDGPALDRGLYSGAVTAEPVAGTAPGAGERPGARLPVGIYAAPEMVDLTIQATAPGATPADTPPVTFYAIVNLDDAGELNRFGALNPFGGFDGDSVTVTVPAGRYSVTGDVATGDPDTDVVAQVGDPDISVTEDTTVAFDGSAAVPLTPRVEGVETAPPTYSGAELVVMPERGSGGYGLLTSIVYSWYPAPPVHVTPMEADGDVLAASQIYRLQAPHLTGESGGQAIELTGVPGHDPEAGAQTLAAVDAGDGTDFSGAEGRLAVVRLPAETWELWDITERAAAAGVAVLAVVDEARSHLTLQPAGWADVPMVAAAGEEATALLAAAAAGDDVTVEVTGTPYVYDIVSPATNRVTAAPVVDPGGLAVLEERYHRDPDGAGATGERRYHADSLMNLDTEGPLLPERTSYVSPDVDWLSFTFGLGYVDWGSGLEPIEMLLSGDAGRSYQAGQHYRLDWLRRPQWPAPMGGSQGASFCQPTPVTRTADRIDVWLEPVQDDIGRYSCADPIEAELTLARDGEVLGTAPAQYGSFDIPRERGTYTLSYRQEARAPYEHRSETTWTFRSQAPAGGEDATAPVPLVVVDYDLPLDTHNRPTGTTASLAVRSVLGEDGPLTLAPRVWTSTDGGETWRRAPVRRGGDGRYDVTLPEVEEGTAVSLRVKAWDLGGNRIDQKLIDAYVG